MTDANRPSPDPVDPWPEAPAPGAGAQEICACCGLEVPAGLAALLSQPLTVVPPPPPKAPEPPAG